MKYFLFLLPFIIFYSCSTKNVAGRKAIHQTKYGLIFAIGNYPPQNGYRVISSLNDVPYIQGALKSQGFTDKNITVVTDEKATLNGIKQALENLINTVHSGDIAVIHFSCHGTQVEADSKNRIDGLDECVVTYNAVSRYVSTDFYKDQAEYLRGHVIGDYLRRLRAKLGNKGDVLVLLDFCCSGGASRSLKRLTKVRGGYPPFVSPHFNPASHTRSDSSMISREENDATKNDTGLAPYVVISATRPDETDNEIWNEHKVSLGPLSYAVSKIFQKLEPGTTYHSLFAQIQSIIHIKTPSQHPSLEGNGSNRALFGGAFITQKPYVELRELNGNQAILQQGILAGLNIGATVEFFPAGTANPAQAKKLASGTVTNAEDYSSSVTLDNNLNVPTVYDVWAFVTNQVFNIMPVNITTGERINGYNFTPAEVDAIESKLTSVPYAALNSAQPELMIMKGETVDSILVVENGYLFDTLTNAAGNAEGLKEKLRRYVQYKFLQTYNVKDTTADIEAVIVPVTNGVADTSKIKTKMVNGIYEFYDGDTLTLLVKNKTENNVYFNVLDLSPTGNISPVYPNISQQVYVATDLVLKPKQNFLCAAGKYWLVVDNTYGTEVFKVFASTERIDLEGIANDPENDERGNLSALEKVFKSSYARRGVRPVASNATGTAFNLLFRIKPRG